MECDNRGGAAATITTSTITSSTITTTTYTITITTFTDAFTTIIYLSRHLFFKTSSVK